MADDRGPDGGGGLVCLLAPPGPTRTRPFSPGTARTMSNRSRLLRDRGSRRLCRLLWMDYRRIARWAFVGYGLALLLLVLVLIVGRSVQGGTRWIDLKALSFAALGVRQDRRDSLSRSFCCARPRRELRSPRGAASKPFRWPRPRSFCFGPRLEPDLGFGLHVFPHRSLHVVRREARSPRAFSGGSWRRRSGRDGPARRGGPFRLLRPNGQTQTALLRQAENLGLFRA